MKPILFVPAFFLLSSALFTEESLPDFASIKSDIDSIENLMLDTMNTLETQQLQLQNLNLTLSERENLIDRQEQLLKTFQAELSEISEIYRKQSAYSKNLERKSNFWKTFTIIGIPAAAVLSGVTAGLIMGRR